MTEKDVILKVTDLRTSFPSGKGKVHAVNGVSFQVERGKTLCIVGESGCGKSVTAHSITQLLPPTGRREGGTISYYPQPGQEVVLSDLKRSSKAMRSILGKDISMVFQDPMSTLNPVYTVGSQIMENLRHHEKLTKAQAKERILTLLGELGIPTPRVRFHQYPHEFSGGMKQRVMIAIAMICKPKLLIADEPTTALDVTIQAQILELIAKLQRDHGTSVILITHNMGIVAEVADSVAVMYMGRIVERGSLRQVFENPLHPYTRALLASVPVLGMDKTQDMKTIEGSTPDAATCFTGCEFAQRCDRACPACSTRFPVDTTVEEEHVVRCLQYEEGGALWQK